MEWIIGLVEGGLSLLIALVGLVLVNWKAIILVLVAIFVLYRIIDSVARIDLAEGNAVGAVLMLLPPWQLS
jgi:hypothetical protein